MTTAFDDPALFSRIDLVATVGVMAFTPAVRNAAAAFTARMK